MQRGRNQSRDAVRAAPTGPESYGNRPGAQGVVMIDGVVGFLACPHCGGALRPIGMETARDRNTRGLSEWRPDTALVGCSLRCPVGHSFDIARQGYVNLLPGDAHTGTADTAEMIASREAFLRSGHYQRVAERVTDAAREAAPEGAEGCVVDVGAGTGYYLISVLEALPSTLGLALDISTFAARRAARAHQRMGAVVCNAWAALPVRTGGAKLVLSVFAPRNPPEFRRILEPDGALIVVVPTGRHLRELVPTLGLLSVDEHKGERLEAKMAGFFTRSDVVVVEERMLLSHEEVETVVGMGPSARHIEAPTLAAQVAQLPEPLGVTLSVAVMLYR